MAEDKLAQFGVVGMGVMGRNLALNIADNGYSTVVYNRDNDVTSKVVSASSGKLRGAPSFEKLVDTLQRPRKIMLMIKAGEPVDQVIQGLRPLLDEDDVLIDGGNSWFRDTQRRESELREAGLYYFGVGVSGGEEGARHGPSIMPGGDAEAYCQIKQTLEAIAAKTEFGPCVTHVGSDGAGHFVKMVHNGIEYADMQFIAEAYDLLARMADLRPAQLASTFDEWNQGPLESFLIEITAKIFAVRDPETDGWLVEKVLDKAGQKGTGRWTAQIALELGIPVPSISAAIDARVISSMKTQRERAANVLAGPSVTLAAETRSALINDIHDALHAAKIVAYAQGMALISGAAKSFNWSIDLQQICRIWTGGCIIRARLLETFMNAYEGNAGLTNLLLDETLRGRIEKLQPGWRRTVSLAQRCGIAVPALGASLAYFDSYRSARLPQNLTQAQRDAFGAHTYQRADRHNPDFVHTDWL